MTIRHPAFLESLGAEEEAKETASTRWRSIAAGFLVLRQVDVWASEGIVLRSAWQATNAVIDELPESDPTRSLLREIARAIQGPQGSRNRRSSLAHLMAYGRALENDAEWALARDVYSVVVDYADVTKASDLLPDAFHRLGYCERLLGDVDAAAAAFTSGRQLAEAQGNVPADLRLRLSESNLLTHRGNLPAAADALDTLIADAASIGEDANCRGSSARSWPRGIRPG